MLIYYQRSWIRTFILLVLAVATVHGAEHLLSRAARYVMLAISGRLVPIYSVETDEKKVALSFDGTWGADYTEKLLEILRKNNVRTTFFFAGYWLEKYPELVKKIAREGHEIGNHSYTHPHMNSLAPSEIRNEIIETHELIKALTGQESRLFRPPFGEYSNKVIEVAKECGYYTIQWSIDSLDWQNLTAAEMIDRVMSKIHNGAIILFHNNGLHTAEAIESLIPQLRSQGYRIVPISELIYKDNYYINPNTGQQRRIRSPAPERRGEDGGPGTGRERASA